MGVCIGWTYAPRWRVGHRKDLHALKRVSARQSGGHLREQVAPKAPQPDFGLVDKRRIAHQHRAAHPSEPLPAAETTLTSCITTDKESLSGTVQRPRLQSQSCAGVDGRVELTM
jgi:hypothetical protein